MAEADTVRKLMAAMKGWDPLRVENICSPGTPDINFIGGWMEVKWVKEYPKRDHSMVTCQHFTMHQRGFLKRRMIMGGATFLFATIARDHYLFDGVTGANYFGFVERRILAKKAYKVWHGQFPKSKDLMGALSDIVEGTNFT